MALIDVLGHKYNIVKTPIEDYGMIAHAKKLITLDTETDAMQYPDFHNMVVLHEAVHAMDWIMGMNFDETTVQGMGNAFLHFIQNNPKLIKAILERKKYG